MNLQTAQTSLNEQQRSFLKLTESINTAESGDASEIEKPSPDSVDTEMERKQEIVGAMLDAVSPDADASIGERFYKVLQENDDALEILQVTPGLAKNVIKAVISRLPIGQHEKAIHRIELDRLKVLLANSILQPVEELLIDQVVICYLRMYLTELAYESALGIELSTTTIRSWELRLSEVQKRYFRAIETLTRVRKVFGCG